MQVRPLHFEKTYVTPQAPPSYPGEAALMQPVYGNSQYVSHDYRWLFYKAEKDWAINHYTYLVDEHQQAFAASGIYEVRFPRLRDAVEVLEHVINGGVI